MDLQECVISVSREVPGDALVKFFKDINRRIFELLQSNDVDEKLGGIAALDKLIDFDSGEENAIKVTRFANYIRLGLPGIDHRVTIRAAKALGHLANAAGSLTTEFVEFEMKRALEWLQGIESILSYFQSTVL